VVSDVAVRQVVGGRDPEGPFGLGLLLLVSCSLVTGALVAAAFLLPGTVGALISGAALLGLGITFVGSTLTLLAALPDRGDERAGNRSTADGRTRFVTVRERLLDRLRATRREVDAPVFVSGVALAAAVIVGFLVVPDRTVAAVAAVERVVFQAGRRVLLVAVLAFVAAAVVLAAGPWGRIRLGGAEATPEFSTPAYVAMLFSAGIAAGIVFWGPAEALLHYDAVPPFLDAAPRTEAAAVGALQYTLFHWGVSVWSVYLAVGLPVAYAVYNRGAPLRVSSVLVPLLGPDATTRPVGRAIDVLAVMATLGGLATTLGFVSAQFLTGIEYRWGVALGAGAEVLLVSGLTLIFAVSAATGIRRGIRRLSGLNAGLFLVVTAALAAFGPFEFLAAAGSSAVANYATDFVPMSLYDAPAAAGWLSAWTAFYWSWWLSWAPFVGLFLARISKGRTVRSVVLASVGATSLATLVWFVIVGGTAVSLQRSGAADILALIGASGVPAAGFPVFGSIPLGDLPLVLFLLLVFTFFVTSADVATRGLGMLTSDRSSPSPALRSVLAVLTGSIAAVLLPVGGSETVRSAAVVVGGPFAVVALVGLAGLAVALARDVRAG
jgi:choline/carnitine/betaine transport